MYKTKMFQQILKGKIVIIGIGNVLIGLSMNLMHLLITVVIINIGYTLHSGTFEALIFDTLKQNKAEDQYNQVLARINSIQLTAYAISSIVGGFMYALNPRLPHIAVGIAGILAMLVSMLLIEPQIDTITFSFQNYLRQTQQGFIQLFKSKLPISYTVLMISIGAFLIVVWENLDNALAVSYGFSDTQMGIFFAGAYIIAALASQLTPWISKKLPSKTALIVLSLLLAASIVVSPWIGLILGGAMIIIRSSLKPIIENITSNIINSQVESKYRATTLSPYQMLTKLPYVITAFMIGFLMDYISVKTFALYFGVLLFVVIALNLLPLLFYKKTAKSK